MKTSKQDSKQEKKIVLAGHVLSVVVALPFIASGIMKLSGNLEVVKGMAHAGIPESLLLPLGILELLCVVIYLVPMTSVLGAILFAGYVGGAILTHLRIGEFVVLQIILGILVWLGLYLREPRLRDLLPLRKMSKR